MRFLFQISLSHGCFLGFDSLLNTKKCNVLLEKVHHAVGLPYFDNFIQVVTDQRFFFEVFLQHPYVLFFCLLLHRSAVRISLPFHIFLQV